MSVTVTSTTDTPEAVAAAQGGKAQESEKVETPAAETKQVTAEKKEASEASTDEKSETEAKEEKEEQKDVAKKPRGVEKKIGKLTKQREAAKQEAAYWRAEALKSQQKPAEKPPEKIAAPSDGQPVADNFETHEAYLMALVDWRADQKLSAADKKAKEQSLKADVDKQVASHREKVSKFVKDHSDFNEMLESIDDIPMSLTVQEVILESDDGPALMYELAKDPEEYARICKLPAIAAARALGKFEARLSKSSDASPGKETKTTKAPPPLSTVGKGSVTVTKDPGEMDYQDYKRYRQEQISKGR